MVDVATRAAVLSRLPHELVFVDSCFGFSGSGSSYLRGACAYAAEIIAPKHSKNTSFFILLVNIVTSQKYTFSCGYTT